MIIYQVQLLITEYLKVLTEIYNGGLKVLMCGMIP